MQVILTPTAVADKFGAGLNGFAGSVPGPPTQLSEQWFDSVQMELVNVILGQGIALDGLVFDQLKQAIDDYSFVDPTISGSLTIDGGATLFVANTALLRVQSGAAVVLENGSTFAVEGNVTLIASNNTWVWGSSNANDWTINGNVTLGTDASSTQVLHGDVTLGTDAASVHEIRGEVGLFGNLDLNGNNLTNASRLALVPGSLPLNAGQLTAGASGVLRYQPAGSALYVHHTDRGYVLGTGATQSGNILAGGSALSVSQVIVTPPATGKVKISFTGYLDFETTATIARIYIRDTTAATILNSGGTGLVEYPIGMGATPFGHSVCGSVTYTLPDASARTFSISIDASIGDVSYTDFTLDVLGVTV
jgi:hypothetical protein